MKRRLTVLLGLMTAAAIGLGVSGQAAGADVLDGRDTTVPSAASKKVSWTLATDDGERQFRVTINFARIRYPVTDACSAWRSTGEGDADPGYTWIRIPYSITNLGSRGDRTNFSFVLDDFRLVDLSDTSEHDGLDPNILNFNNGTPCERSVLRGEYSKTRGILPGGTMRGTFISTWQITGPEGFGIEYADTSAIVDGPALPVSLTTAESESTSTSTCPILQSGSWRGNFTSSVVEGGGSVEATVNVENGALSGNIEVTNSSLPRGDFTGTLQCDQIDLGIFGGVVTFTGIVAADGESASGTYDAPSLNDRGTWRLQYSGS